MRCGITLRGLKATGIRKKTDNAMGVSLAGELQFLFLIAGQSAVSIDAVDVVLHMLLEQESQGLPQRRTPPGHPRAGSCRAPGSRHRSDRSGLKAGCLKL